jgi:hypothetical protein
VYVVNSGEFEVLFKVKVKLSQCLINSALCCEDMGGGGVVPPFVTSALDGGERSASCPSYFNPEELPLLPIGEEAGWTSELVWMLWRKKCCHARKQTLGIQPVAC